MIEGSLSVLFLPGLLCTAPLFEYQIPRLPEGYYGALNPLPTAATMEEMGRQVWDQHSGSHILCGLSLGGILCMEMFKQRPQQVRGLILMDTNSMDEQETVSEARLNLIEEAEKSSPGEIADRILFEKQVHPSFWGYCALRRGVRDMADSYGLVKLKTHGMALAGREDYSSLLRTVNCPVLIISGEGDRICPEEKQVHLQSLMPRAERVVIPEAGHLSSLEQPEAVSKTINNWLIENYPSFLAG